MNIFLFSGGIQRPSIPAVGAHSPYGQVCIVGHSPSFFFVGNLLILETESILLSSHNSNFVANPFIRVQLPIIETFPPTLSFIIFISLQ